MTDLINFFGSTDNFIMAVGILFVAVAFLAPRHFLGIEIDWGKRRNIAAIASFGLVLIVFSFPQTRFWRSPDKPAPPPAATQHATAEPPEQKLAAPRSASPAPVAPVAVTPPQPPVAAPSAASTPVSAPPSPPVQPKPANTDVAIRISPPVSSDPPADPPDSTSIRSAVMFEQRPESLCGVSGITAEAWKASDGYNLLQKATVKIPGRGQGRTVAVGEKTPITASCGIVLEKVDLLGGQAAMYVSETPIRPGAKDSKLQYINQEKP